MPDETIAPRFSAALRVRVRRSHRVIDMLTPDALKRAGDYLDQQARAKVPHHEELNRLAHALWQLAAAKGAT